MKNILIAILTFITLHTYSQNDTVDFAKGADIGWLSEMEASGYKFYSDSGIEQDCMDILKDHGINSLRFRVWVNPTEKWCGKDDVVTMAKRAKDKGFRIMIDFHYSDWWADPGQQNIPAAWANDTLEQMAKHLFDHTYDVLDSLKQNDIIPEWVQVGNETNNGMLWPMGKASASMKNYAILTQSGYNAIKAVDSTIKVIVHISNGYKNSTFRWIFDGLKNNGTKWDVIGMSLYPGYANLAWATVDEQCLANMKDMIARYGTQVMICEVGMDKSKAKECKDFLTDIQVKTYSVGGLGVFYWEPECYNWKGYNLGAWDAVTKAPTLAMDAFLIDPANPPVNNFVINLSQGVGLYPNPITNNILSVIFDGKTGTADIKVLNVNGQVMNTQILKSANSHKIDCSGWSTGVYFLQYSNGNEKFIKTFVVK